MRTLFNLCVALLVSMSALLGMNAQVEMAVAVYVTGSDTENSIKKALGDKLVSEL